MPFISGAVTALMTFILFAAVQYTKFSIKSVKEFSRCKSSAVRTTATVIELLGSKVKKNKDSKILSTTYVYKVAVSPAGETYNLRYEDTVARDGEPELHPGNVFDVFYSETMSNDGLAIHRRVVDANTVIKNMKFAVCFLSALGVLLLLIILFG